MTLRIPSTPASPPEHEHADAESQNRTAAKPRALSATGALTAITARLFGTTPETTAVIIDDLPAARWHTGGSTGRRPAAMLEISITRGTHTDKEKVAFIAAAFDELRPQLAAGGALEEASYVIVRELPATDWGYGGQTQQAREVSRQPVAA